MVVVGGGTAGAVVAARLSQHPHVAVSVLEAGPARHAAELDGSSFVDAMAVPHRLWAGLHARRAEGQAPSPYHCGRGVGGSSSVNAMVALRPGAHDLLRWESLGGWGRELTDVATDLPVSAAADGEIGPLSAAVLATDPDAEVAPLTRFANGRRAGTYAAYLEPAVGRTNLVVRGDSLVDRVVFADRRARGVVLASGEVIAADHVVVCAGAIHSPAILLRSGVDTPGVGDNLQDHPSFPLHVDLRHPVPHGVLPISTVVRCRRAGGELQLVPVEVPGESTATMLAAVMTVRSTGTVRLVDHDPATEPEVRCRMLSDARDEALLHAAIDRAEGVLAGDAVGAIGTPVAFDRSRVRAGLGDYVHAAGTCAMGSVVDRRLAVQQYTGLYVCDTSVMPSVPAVNTYLPAVIIAERFATLWLAAHDLRPSSPS